MPEDPSADLVARQYKRWRYPEPIQSLENWISGNWERFDPSHAHRLLWPDRRYRPELDILSAGCGTNQAAAVAYTNPAAKVTGIDISQESLDHGRYLKDRYGLANLELRLLPIEEVADLNRDFDLIMCTGVLHHLASPEAGLAALAGVLRPDGVAALMVYARYGRLGVEIMQSAFRDMGLVQDERSLDLVKAAVASIPPSHPLSAYLAIAPDVQFDAGLVDTFLHGRDRSYTVDDCLALVESAGLVFQDWLLKSNYYPFALDDHDDAFVAAVEKLPREQMWSVVERINTGNACHFFLATPPVRPAASYRIDFGAPGAVDYVPIFRHQCGITGQELFRPGWSTRLTPVQQAMAGRVDGESSIAQIARQVAGGPAADGMVPSELETVARRLFDGLWRADFVVIDSSRTA